MKKIFISSLRMLTRLSCLFIIIFLLSQGCSPSLKSQAIAQPEIEFRFNPVSEWEEIAENTYIVTGTHNLADENYIWIFLRDQYSNLYLQFPPVALITEDAWEATNVRIGNGIRYIWAIQVKKEGDQTLREMVENQEWGAIQQARIEGLPGYLKLASLTITTLPPSPPITAPTPSPTPSVPSSTATSTPVELLIADFNTGRDPINSGGRLQQWDYGTKFLTVETGYGVDDDGVYAAFATFTAVAEVPEGEWAGGGVVVMFQDDESAIDLSDYKFLEFDVKIQPGSVLEKTRVKLESPPKDNYIERSLSEYGITSSGGWQSVRIPLEHFARKRSSDPDYQKETDPTAVGNFVTVSVRDSNAPDTQGTLLFDNIRFTK